MTLLVLVRGGGDLASGVIARLYKTGFQVIVTELPEPLAVRRSVAFSEAVIRGSVEVEDIRAQKARDVDHVCELLAEGVVPVLVDPEARCRLELNPAVIVDGRMTKKAPDLGIGAADLVIGLGPGFIAGVNCDAVIETKRGHFLGRVYWSGTAEKDTGLPEPVSNFEAERVLRAPAAGMLITTAEVGDEIQAGGLIANVGDHEVRAQFHGVLRGLLPNGMQVTDGMKIGDLDPRIDGRYYRHISDKALAIGGGVLEAIFAKENLRKRLIEP